MPQDFSGQNLQAGFILVLNISAQGASLIYLPVLITSSVLAVFVSAKFKKKHLTRTCWYQAKHLNRARLSDSILADTSVRQLLVTGDDKRRIIPHAIAIRVFLFP